MKRKRFAEVAAVSSILYIGIFLLASCTAPRPRPVLQHGDLLFNVGRDGAVTQAIARATSTGEDIPYTHVGIVEIDGSDTSVIEAISRGVVRTPLREFLERAACADGQPLVTAGRVRPEYRRLVPQAVRWAASRIGAPYDSTFLSGNRAYYCSELVYEAFQQAAGREVFRSKPMTFRDLSTGEFPRGWVDYFASRGVEIPEGEPGTNPADMSRDPAVELIHHYFTPAAPEHEHENPTDK